MNHCCETKTDELAPLRERQARILKTVLAIDALLIGSRANTHETADADVP